MFRTFAGVALLLIIVLSTTVVLKCLATRGHVLDGGQTLQQELASEFAQAFAKYSEINEQAAASSQQGGRHQWNSVERIQSSPSSSDSSSLSNHFVLKTRMENDDLVNSIAHKYGLKRVRKIPSSDGSVNYILRGVGVMDESYGDLSNVDTVRAMSGTSALLTTQTLQNMVKKNSDTVLEFYRAKKQNFSKR
ncbi:hypothetical protein FDP41_006913 [Naegleria fowleri]|uniref:Uncharacterized protein n=1 Tax=Naegleria fowleri TaxID=5763 RepID=A0A6A5B753_NAEFO|nr:uncharacterized protein FDP41_007011 [Naegleria fowleri]XP_044559016.1 uncharacterized protein FDP41_006913 [Naegleria fowleri]KAF0973979.1 hypothetical protein FDP41_007011 [Naegleria fowleri]KAF0974303.1 hypothetical protein FDP41_006913 [Naegleria fowleri]CAG4712285.1 unnamed protein product [Naegleria fowleri]